MWMVIIYVAWNYIRTYAKSPQRRFPCRAHLRMHAQIVAQASSMLLEFPASPSLSY